MIFPRLFVTWSLIVSVQPREALLKYADAAEKDPQWTAGEFFVSVAVRPSLHVFKILFGSIYITNMSCPFFWVFVDSLCSYSLEDQPADTSVYNRDRRGAQWVVAVG